jgi:hypothetical protein
VSLPDASNIYSVQHTGATTLQHVACLERVAAWGSMLARTLQRTACLGDSIIVHRMPERVAVWGVNYLQCAVCPNDDTAACRCLTVHSLPKQKNIQRAACLMEKISVYLQAAAKPEWGKFGHFQGFGTLEGAVTMWYKNLTKSLFWLLNVQKNCRGGGNFFDFRT